MSAPTGHWRPSSPRSGSSARAASCTATPRAGTRVAAAKATRHLGVQKLYGFLEELGFETAVFDAAQAKFAVGAFARFGKGMGHRAQLNFGDCAVYALAAMRGEPLLATGNDF